LTPDRGDTRMTRAELQSASKELQEAAAAVDDSGVEERIYDQSREFAELADADRGPDHGRLARHTKVLDEIAESVDGAALDHVQAAREHVVTYREGVEGV
jgi:hypothetical protein